VHRGCERAPRARQQIVPMENEVGRATVERGQLCERKNGRGVDTNRNWEVHWGFKEKDYDPKEEFPGTRPFRRAAPAAPPAPSACMTGLITALPASCHCLHTRPRAERRDRQGVDSA